MEGVIAAGADTTGMDPEVLLDPRIFRAQSVLDAPNGRWPANSQGYTLARFNLPELRPA